ncbi:hypothetical protein T265_04327 [Opisthorchis viverrini]|uniref:Uncharacterized protein n=1 Tax=Opisthorchis viverrini TaxID=6198 RepID=A0A074ZP90_OPIVI|nr:hypothetical protein T265_04327 [Opisthorchis viverrini]KER28946.1 hypothetical protein T265_04327 [Opisthorchis viverrini]
MHQFISSRLQCAATYLPPKSSVNETVAATTTVRRITLDYPSPASVPVTRIQNFGNFIAHHVRNGTHRLWLSYQSHLLGRNTSLDIMFRCSRIGNLDNRARSISTVFSFVQCQLKEAPPGYPSPIITLPCHLKESRGLVYCQVVRPLTGEVERLRSCSTHGPSGQIHLVEEEKSEIRNRARHSMHGIVDNE